MNAVLTRLQKKQSDAIRQAASLWKKFFGCRVRVDQALSVACTNHTFCTIYEDLQRPYTESDNWQWLSRVSGKRLSQPSEYLQETELEILHAKHCTHGPSSKVILVGLECVMVRETKNLGGFGLKARFQTRALWTGQSHHTPGNSFWGSGLALPNHEWLCYSVIKERVPQQAYYSCVQAYNWK